MKKKSCCRFCLLHAGFALLAGGAIYWLWGGGTYVNEWFGGSHLPSDGPLATFLRNYAEDYYWGYALCMALLSLWETRTALCLTLAFGAGWELLQGVGVVSGTGDLLDVLGYLAACGTAVWIVKRRNEGKQ